MSRHVPLTVRARAIVDRVGGIKNTSADLLCEELKIDKKAAWRILWMMRNRPNTGKAERGPYSRGGATVKTNSKGHTKDFIHPQSAAAKLLGALASDTSPEEKAFLAMIQFIGVVRAETLLQEFKAGLTKDLTGVGK